MKNSVLRSAFIGAVSGDDVPAVDSSPGMFEKARHYAGFYYMNLLLDKIELYKYVRLRRRYLVNRNNRLRLRYVATACAGILAAGVTAFGSSAVSFAGRLAGDAYYTAASYSLAPQDRDSTAGFQAAETAVSSEMRERISDGMRRASLAIQKAPKRDFEEVEIGRGDTIAGALQKAGVSGNDSYSVVQALSEHYNPRGVRPGQKLMVHFKPGTVDATPEFARLTMDIDPVKEIAISKSGEKFESKIVEKKLVKNTYAGKAEIQTSLYGSAARAGIPSQVVAEAIRIYSWNIDFQRDIQPGDKIEVLYEAEETEDGEYARFGNLLYANLTVGGKEVPIYRYEMNDGRVDYFQPDGFSIRKTLMSTPIDGARITSGFGMRRHPVLGYNKMHKGVDFAAPTGTPIFAAGNGTLEYAGRFSSFGNYIRIRHNGQMKTAYAHMSRLAKGMTVGKRVNQGDVIGYVGTTGRSTGPHLHYEVMVNNAQVNPRSVNLPTGEQLLGKDLQRFKSLMSSIHQQYVSLTDGFKFAMFGNSGANGGVN